MTYATVPLIMTTAHGGARAGAGRKSVFAAKALSKPFAMDFTPAGRARLDALVDRTGLSRNAVIATLALQFGDDVVFTDGVRPYPAKARTVLSIRMPRDAAAKLAAARIRTGRSYSDVGEELVTTFGRKARYPRVRR